MSENWKVLSFWLKLSLFGALLITILASRLIARIFKALPPFVSPRTEL